MNDSNLVKISLNDQIKFSLKERKEINKKLSKYIIVFDYIDKIFITLSASFGILSLVSHATIVGIPVGIAGSSLTVVFSLTIGIVKKITKCYKEKKNNKIIMLAKNELNNIETLISKALIDLDISHGDFKKIIDEKEKYERMKENIKNTKSTSEIDTLSQRDNTLS